MLKGVIATVALALIATPALADSKKKPAATPTSGVYKFAGYSLATVPGDAGFVGMHAACQADFGPSARMCTTEEYSKSPNAQGTTTPAWVHPSTPAPGGVPPLDFSGADAHAGSCGGWSRLGGGGFAVVNERGHVTSINCLEPRPVTCCTPQP